MIYSLYSKTVERKNSLICVVMCVRTEENTEAVQRLLGYTEFKKKKSNEKLSNESK